MCDRLRSFLLNTLEIPALLWRRSKHSGKLCLRESLIDGRKQQGRQSSRMDRAQQCLRPHLRASARVLLRGQSGWRGNENKFAFCVSSVVLWLFLRPACAPSPSHSNDPSWHFIHPLLKGDRPALQPRSE